MKRSRETDFENNRNKIARKYIDLNPPKWKNYDRSMDEITKDDLKKMLEITLKSNEEFLKRKPKYKSLKKLCVCLCQGGGKHYVDGKTGLRDIDIYTFYEDHPTIKYPYRRRAIEDFGKSKFGKNTKADKDFILDFDGKPMDIMGRQIEFENNYEDSIKKYLSEAKTKTAYYLSLKNVVVLEPIEDLGKVIW